MESSPIPLGFGWADALPDGAIDEGFLENLDVKLQSLLREIGHSESTAEVRLAVRDLCDQVTHTERPDHRIGLERNRLLQPYWQETWAESQEVHTALFHRLRGLLTSEQCEYLYQAFRQLVRFVAEGKTDFIRDQIAPDLSVALGSYLSLRGYSLPHVRKASTRNPDEPRETAGFSHSPDFCTVTWGKRQFHFNVRQAACVAVMWVAFSEENPFLSQCYILANAAEQYPVQSRKAREQLEGLENMSRLRDLFKTGSHKVHEAWRTMIVKSGRDLYGLAAP